MMTEQASCYVVERSNHKYVGPPQCWAEMYAGRVACCPLVSRGEYADGTYRQTDGRETDTSRFQRNSRKGLT